MQLAYDLGFLHTIKGSGTALQAWASWSLAVEIWFYALIPVTLILVYRISRGKEATLAIMLSLLAAVGVFLRALCVYSIHGPVSEMSVWMAVSRPYVRFDELLIGVLAYVLGRKVMAKTNRAILWTGGIVIAAVFAFLARPFGGYQWFTTTSWVFMPTLLSIGFACVLVGSFATRFVNPLVTVIANMSYSLYLMHAMVTLVVSRQTHPESFALEFVFASLIAAYLASLLVEYPFLKMYKKPVLKKVPSVSITFEPIELSPPQLSILASRGKI
jgi:peptidoglycan/LPS O-acetylase OafA/YrhL